MSVTCPGPDLPTCPPPQIPRRPPKAPRLALWLTLILSLCGCGDSEKHQTLVAANERINDLNKEKTRLEKVTADLQGKLVASEADLAKRHDARLANLTKDFEDRQARLHQIHEEKVAQLENSIAGLRLELGAARRETIVLRGLVDRTPRVEAARKTRSGKIEAILGLFGGLTLLVLVVVASRHRLLRQRHDRLVVRRAASSPILER